MGREKEVACVVLEGVCICQGLGLLWARGWGMGPGRGLEPPWAQPGPGKRAGLSRAGKDWAVGALDEAGMVSWATERVRVRGHPGDSVKLWRCVWVAEASAGVWSLVLSLLV